MTRIVAPTGETQVTVRSATSDEAPSVTVLKDGGWVVTWVSITPNGSIGEIHQQRYDFRGQPIGQDLRVTTRTGGFKEGVDVAALPDGGWMVTWTGDFLDGLGSNVYQQRYNALGQEIGPERIVNTTLGNFQHTPSVSALTDGGWVITWNLFVSSSDYDVYQRRFDRDGYEIGTGEHRVNTAQVGNQFATGVTALKDGGWVVTWTSDDGNGNLGIYQQRYDSAGLEIRGETQVNTARGDILRAPSVTALADGGWVVTWSCRAIGGTGFDIHQQRFHSNGWSVGREAIVNVASISDQFASDVTALPDGGWLVTWVSSGLDRMGDIYQRRYAANGQALSGEDILVNTTVAGDQQGPSVSVLPDGGWIVTWQGAPGEIYQQRFTASGEKIGPMTPTGLTFVAQAVSEGDPGTGSAGTLVPKAFVPGGEFTYTLLDEAGGRFRLEGSQIKVKDGIKLDYEQAASHQVTVQVRDAAGATFTTAVAITVSDVAAERLTGGAASDVLKGGDGRDSFNGSAGDDVLWGGAGHDVLSGGNGRDVFVFAAKFNAGTNKDKIVDFKVKDDSFWLDNAVFSKLGQRGSEANPAQLKKGLLVIGSAAKDRDDYLIYDKAKGVLLFDPDGSGRGKAVEIATLTKNLGITHKDFFII